MSDDTTADGRPDDSATAGGTPGQRIVVGVDGSAHSVAALCFAVHQASLTGASVHAMIAWTMPNTFGGPMPETVDWEADAGTVLDDAIAEALPVEQRAAIRRHVVKGHPARLLVRETEDAAEMVVVGSRGRSGVAGLLLGSVSQYVAAHAHCPTVVVRPLARPAGVTPGTGPRA